MSKKLAYIFAVFVAIASCSTIKQPISFQKETGFQRNDTIIKSEIAPSITPIQVTSIVPNNKFQYSIGTVYSCMSDTLTIGYLLVPKEDEHSMQIFNRSVSVDLWDEAVGISQKRYVPDLVDVQQAESILAKVMRDGVLPKMGRYNQNIGNLDNYTKYERTYGFYYNEKEEKCVYIQMELSDPSFPRFYVGFGKSWDGCDTEVFINLNLEKHEVIRAYPSTCQSY